VTKHLLPLFSSGEEVLRLKRPRQIWGKKRKAERSCFYRKKRPRKKCSGDEKGGKGGKDDEAGFIERSPGKSITMFEERGRGRKRRVRQMRGSALDALSPQSATRSG